MILGVMNRNQKELKTTRKCPLIQKLILFSRWQ